jgi:hypothetical protein
LAILAAALAAVARHRADLTRLQPQPLDHLDQEAVPIPEPEVPAGGIA